MIYGSICSGIESATAAWHPLGWKPAFFSEIEPFPRAVLQHNYPHITCHGDFTTIRDTVYASIDVLVGGTPCQSFSIAGLRQGFADQRGILTLEFVRLAQRLRPRWLVWENVPGVLSIDGGRAFGSFLGGLGECGYGFAYRILDAQYFGVPQRRRRVFVIGYLGDWRPPAAVLFERDCLRRDITPSRETGKGIAGSIAPSLVSNGDGSRGFRDEHGLITSTGPTSHCLNAGGMGRQDYETETLVVFNVTFCDANGRRQDRPNGGLYVNETDQAKTVTSGGDLSTYIGCFKAGQGARSRSIGYSEHLAPTLESADSGSNRIPTLMAAMHVRRLTPIECERLQGFPDNYTLVPFRGRSATDGNRYKALGNSMAVPVMRWLGERMQLVESLNPIAMPDRPTFQQRG
jgi:DNA (cytosine-5)-methyltransferase 1